MNAGVREAPQDIHVTKQVEGGNVTEDGEESGQAYSLGCRVGQEIFSHDGLETPQLPQEKDHTVGGY